MAQFAITITWPDGTLAQDIADIKLVLPELPGGETNLNYAKRIIKEFLVDSVKDGQIIRLKSEIPGQVTNPGITT